MYNEKAVHRFHRGTPGSVQFSTSRCSSWEQSFFEICQVSNFKIRISFGTFTLFKLSNIAKVKNIFLVHYLSWFYAEYLKVKIIINRLYKELMFVLKDRIEGIPDSVLNNITLDGFDRERLNNTATFTSQNVSQFPIIQKICIQWWFVYAERLFPADISGLASFADYWITH